MENAASSNYKDECSDPVSGPHKHTFTVRPFQLDRLFVSLGPRDKIKYSNLKVTHHSDHVLPPRLVKSPNVAQELDASSLKQQHQHADTTA
jgi:hypothetical protein